MDMPTRRRLAVGILVMAALLAAGLLGRTAFATPSEAETRALAEARQHVSAGHDVDAVLPEHTSLLSYPAMNVTRLHKAAEYGWVEVARYLVEHGARIRALADTKSHLNRLEPMDLATLGGHADVVRLLKRAARPRTGVSRRLEIDGPTEGRRTISFDENNWEYADLIAPEKRVPTSADVLIEPDGSRLVAMTRSLRAYGQVGADPAVATGLGGPWGTSLDSAHLRQGATFAVRTSIGSLYAVRILALDPKQGRIVLEFTRHVAPPAAPPTSRRDSATRSPQSRLQEALVSGDSRALRAALEAGADPNAVDFLGAGWTTLHFAARYGRAEMIRPLLQHAYHPEAGVVTSSDPYRDAQLALLAERDPLGMTALHFAAYRGAKDVVEELLKMGAQRDETDPELRTPLHYAALGDSVPVVQMLLARGAPAHAQAADGNRAEDLATSATIKAILARAARESGRKAARGIGRLLAVFLESLRQGDASTIRACMTAEGVAALSGNLQPMSFEAKRERVRIGAREAAVEYVLTVEKETPLGRRFRLVLDLADPQGQGKWKVARAVTSPD